MDINVLHLCSYYYGSKLYENLFKDLGEKNIKQVVYVPIKTGLDIGKINDFNNCNFIIKETNNNLDRLFFKRKAMKNYTGLLSQIDINDFSIIHAHTLFTNGYMAYELNKIYKIPYIVAVRNTDVNVFFKYFIHLRKLGIDILLRAEKIIFISPSYKENTINTYIPEKYKKEIESKSIVLPNGLNDYWIKNRAKSSKSLEKDILRLTYVGEVTKNKNIHKVIQDISHMINKGMNIRYDIVGDGEYLENIKSLVNEKKLNDHIRIFGKINDKDKIREIFNENDIFVMTSTFETFGLSYIEALSQGLPVLYTKGQGIYGYYQEGYVGYAVDNGDSIEESLNKLMCRYNEMSANAIEVIEEFEWGKIGDKYIDIYSKLLKK